MFFVFSFAAFHRVRVERDKAKEENKEQLESIRKANPSIEVRPLRGTELDHCLEVRNIGAAGEFSAQIELIEGHSLGGRTNDYPYAGFWELANSGRARIQCNQTDRLKLVAFDVDNKERKRRMRFYYTDSKTGSLNFYDSKWVTKDTISRCKIRVTISSVPDLLGQSYILEKELHTWGLKWLEQWVKVKSQ